MQKEYESLINYLVSQFKVYLDSIEPWDLTEVLDDLVGMLPTETVEIPDDILTCDRCKDLHGGICPESEDEDFFFPTELCHIQFKEFYENNHRIIWGTEDDVKKAILKHDEATERPPYMRKLERKFEPKTKASTDK